MKVTIKGKNFTAKAVVEGPLKQKMAFIEALTGVKTEPEAMKSQESPNEPRD